MSSPCDIVIGVTRCGPHPPPTHTHTPPPDAAGYLFAVLQILMFENVTDSESLLLQEPGLLHGRFYVRRRKEETKDFEK